MHVPASALAALRARLIASTARPRWSFVTKPGPDYLRDSSGNPNREEKNRFDSSGILKLDENGVALRDAVASPNMRENGAALRDNIGMRADENSHRPPVTELSPITASMGNFVSARTGRHSELEKGVRSS